MGSDSIDKSADKTTISITHPKLVYTIYLRYAIMKKIELSLIGHRPVKLSLTLKKMYRNHPTRPVKVNFLNIF